MAPGPGSLGGGHLHSAVPSNGDFHLLTLQFGNPVSSPDASPPHIHSLGSATVVPSLLKTSCQDPLLLPQDPFLLPALEEAPHPLVLGGQLSKLAWVVSGVPLIPELSGLARLLEESWSPANRRGYSPYWHQSSSWCLGRETDIVIAPVSDKANFLS